MVLGDAGRWGRRPSGPLAVGAAGGVRHCVCLKVKVEPARLSCGGGRDSPTLQNGASEEPLATAVPATPHGWVRCLVTQSPV